MSAFTVRSASLTDAEMLGHIGVATFVESYSDQIEGQAMVRHCTEQHSADVYAQYLRAPDTGCWLAEHAQTRAPIGYALNCTPDLPIDTAASDIELKRIYLLSGFHGQGIADALLQASIGHARSLDCKRLLLGTYEDNRRAMSFYAKHGFTTIGARKFNIGGKIFDDIIMAKYLTQ